MSTSAFQQGAIVDIKGQTHILLRKIEDNLWQAEESRTKRIQEFTEHQLHSLYVAGNLKFVSSEKFVSQVAAKKQSVANYAPKQWEAAKIRRAYVIATLDLPNTRSYLIPIIQETWQKLQKPETCPNAATVIRWKNKFLQAGKDITALIEKNDQKGNAKSRYSSELEQFVQQSIEVVYLRKERGTIQDTLDRAIIFTLRENELQPDAKQLPLPTRRLVTRKIMAVPAFDRYAARHGHMAAIKRFRSVLAHRTAAAPLERAEIDHTLLDVFVIDDKTFLPLGRPWLTACIDDYTRNILGIFVSFEPPSHFSVARCLKHAFLPKISLKTDYPAIKNTWEAHGVMRELVVDNGAEFHSASLENACYSLGIEIHYSARKTPWFKGKIERVLGTINRAVAHCNPGTTFCNIFEKEDYDPSKHAVVRYSVLKEIIYTWIADVYHQRPHSALDVPPAVMWKVSIKPEEILVPDDPARLDAILGRSEDRCLTHKGIELYGLLYNSPELTALRREHGDKLNVEIRVDTADLGQITVFSPDKRQIFSVPAINSAYAAGLSEWQHRVCKRFAAREYEKYTPTAWLEAKAHIAKLVEDEFMYKKQKTRTKIARYKGDANLLNPSEPDPTYLSEITKPAIAEVPEIPLPSYEDTTIHATPEKEAAVPLAKKKFKPVYRERLPSFVEPEHGKNWPNE